MRILMVDQDLYWQAFVEALQKHGVEVVSATPSAAAGCLDAGNFDGAIVDVQAEDDLEVSQRYAMLRAFSHSAWARSHEVSVYSRVPKREFEQRAADLDIDLARVRFYSKSSLEAPPSLECIREEIRRWPLLVGVDMADSVPAAITNEWIEAQASVFDPLAEYVWIKVVREGAGQTEDEVFREAAPGLRWIWGIMRLNSEVLNGGFKQFISNALLGDATGHSIIEALDAVQELRVLSLCRLLEDTLLALSPLLPQTCAKEIAERCDRGRQSGTVRSSLSGSAEDAKKCMENFDERFDDLANSWVAEIDSYIHANPEQFVDR